jgi:predicted aspartyl protease
MRITASVEFLEGAILEREFQVDATTFYTAINPKLRDQLGVAPGMPVQTQITDGVRLPRIDLKRPTDTIIQSELVLARVRIADRDRIVPIEIFDVPEPVIGKSTLDALMLRIDEVNDRLIPRGPWPPQESEIHAHTLEVDSLDQSD